MVTRKENQKSKVKVTVLERVRWFVYSGVQDSCVIEPSLCKLLHPRILSLFRNGVGNIDGGVERVESIASRESLVPFHTMEDIIYKHLIESWFRGF